MTIPHVLHQIWAGPDPFPDQYEEWAYGWRHLHPGWEYRLWTEPPINLYNQNLWDGAESVSQRPWQFRADVWRYEILADIGGVYVDADFEPRQPLTSLCAGYPDGWVPQHDPVGIWVINGLIAAPARHPALLDAIRGLAANVTRESGSSNTRLSGPQYWTPIARRHQMTEVPSAWFVPYQWNELDRADEPFPDALAVHRWNNAMEKAGIRDETLNRLTDNA